MFDLHDKKIAFFGSVGYLATPIVWKMAELGANLFLADREGDLLKQTARDIAEKYPKQTFDAVVMDGGDYVSIDESFDCIKKRFGKLDAMVSGIAAANNLRVEEFTPEAMNRTFAVQITGSFLLARHAAVLMPSGGSMVLFSSMYGQVAPDPSIYSPPMKPNPIDYGMAKAALNQMVRYLAVHWGPRNIRVNGVAPGPFPNRGKYRNEEEFLERLDRKVPMKRVGRRDEMAGAVIYLVSDAASFTNGQILNVDGGWTAW